MSKRIIWLIACVMASGCGYHLRGSADLPDWLSPLQIENEITEKDFIHVLKKGFLSAGVHVNETSAVVLTILKLDRQKRVLSVDRRGKAQEFLLTYTLTYKVSHEGREVSPVQSLDVSRGYAFDENDVLASQAEVDMLEKDLLQDMGSLLIRRLQTLTDSSL